jgi:hypothetical protein
MMPTLIPGVLRSAAREERGGVQGHGSQDAPESLFSPPKDFDWILAIRQVTAKEDAA